MSLQEPTSKMSKSDPNENGFISILDDHDAIMRKFKRAVTDSESQVVYKDGKDGINNLINIYTSVTGKTVEETEKEFDGLGYGAFKEAVGTAVSEHLKPVREKYADLIKDKAYLETVYKTGAERAAYVARKTLSKTYRKIGFVNR